MSTGDVVDHSVDRSNKNPKYLQEMGEWWYYHLKKYGEERFNIKLSYQDDYSNALHFW